MSLAHYFITGDCRQVLPTIPDSLFDAIITDPPYALKFMGRGGDCTSVAFQPETWRQVLRVSKPGGYLLACGGTRTFHRLACAIEDAGWQVKDTIMWLHGQGFPKGKACLKPSWEPVTWAQKPLSQDSELDTILEETTSHIEALLWLLAPVSFVEACLRGKEPDSARLLASTLRVASRSALSDLTAMFRSPEAGSIFLSIACLWNAILAENFTNQSTFIIGTATGLRTVYKILKSLISQTTPENIIQAAKANAGFWRSASTVSDSMKAQNPGLCDTLKPSAPENASWHTARSVASTLVSIAESLLRLSPASKDSSAERLATPITGLPIVDAILYRINCSNLSPAWEPVLLASKPGPKVLPLGIDECRIGTGEDKGVWPKTERTDDKVDYRLRNRNVPTNTKVGRWPANVILDDSEQVAEAFAAFGDRSCRDGTKNNRNGQTSSDGSFQGWSCGPGPHTVYGDSGTAARFFFTAKASRSERGPDNRHPTVKPLSLMRWLVRLVTPPGGLVLDPFSGSGTTLLACALEGRSGIGIELYPTNNVIAQKRLANLDTTKGES